MDVKLILAVVIAVAVLVYAGYWFFNQPTATKISNVKEFLKWAVMEAESALGSGTGQLKLRYVYDLTVQRFPWVGQLVPFNTFSKWVDEALNWAQEQLDTNESIKAYIQG